MCLGTTGEASTLNDGERRLVAETVIAKARGRVPVIVGSMSNCTAQSVGYVREAKELGADGALVITPYFNRPTPEGCVCHFEEAAKVGLPIIAYHHPSRTAVRLPLNALLEIASIVHAMKEGSGDVELTLDVCRQTSIPILAGDDTLTMPLMAGGCQGVCSVVANVIPDKWKEMTDCMLKGDMAGGRKIAMDHFSLCKALFAEVNPQCVKYALSVMGKCNAKMRLPLLEPREETKRLVQTSLMSLGSCSIR
jgi:4-hydroxy-tetrahydrodipicolinate synthase